MKPEPLGWRPGLQGLRGVAVLLVIFFHIHATGSLFVGGSLGVDIFFVLSGFLITTLLLEEKAKTGAISLPGFYRRRARRLLPALVGFLAVYVAINLLTHQPHVERIPLTIVTAMSYVYNWIDDFGAHGGPGSAHLWSLSVEEQFYLVWPLVLMLALRARPQVLFWTSLVVFAVSASLPYWSGREYGDMYSGTDYRAHQLMVGAIVAQLRYAGAITPSMAQRPLFKAAAILSAAFFGFWLFSLQDRVAFLYAGFYPLAAMAAGVLVCVALYTPGRLLANPVMSYIGSRSYALYLWHHVIVFWLRDLNDPAEIVGVLALSFLAAEVSWQLVERRNSLASWAVSAAMRRITAGPGLRVDKPATAVSTVK